MAVLAGIGAMPDTIEDRAIIISLRRKTAAEPVRKVPHPPRQTAR